MPLHFASPDPGLIGTVQTTLANAAALKQLRRAAFHHLPFPTLASDVGDTEIDTVLQASDRPCSPPAFSSPPAL